MTPFPLLRLPLQRITLLGFGLWMPILTHAQTGSLETDTLRLNEVTVQGYAANRALLHTPAPISVLTTRDLQQRFGLPTPVAALNTLPGVRADERSPGSYRLAIRGSAIRSPFGVRNVKAYWNDLPLTDAGGNTPLNALDIRTMGQVEVLKGPSGSLYGAGTGGTLLFSGLAVPANSQRVEVSGVAGDFGLFGNGLRYQTGQPNTALTVTYNHLQTNGYRQQSAMVRDNLQATGSFAVSDRRTISVLGFYSDLHYQTPGGLTEAQFKANPKAARPATRATPGSVEQHAGIYQKIGYLGFSQQYRWNDRFQNSTAVFGSMTDFANPFITNYEKRADQSWGGRSTTQLRFPQLVWPTTFNVGFEFLRTYTADRNFGNRAGTPDTLQSNADLTARQSTLFMQSETELPAQFRLTLGLSRNSFGYRFQNFPLRGAATLQNRGFSAQWLPRVALQKQVGSQVSTYISISTGFSAPSSQEVLPSAGGFNATLSPEKGISYEWGLRGSAARQRFQFDVSAYTFQLRETIVRRSNAAGAEYFVNAGHTGQKGVEASLSYDFIKPQTPTGLNRLRLWHTLTLTDYRYRQYVQGSTDLSGHRIPGVAPATLVTGLDAATTFGLYAFATFLYQNPFPLDDANTLNALPTRLLQATLGYRRTVGGRWTADLYVSGDNLLNQTYSLGYDLNAFGGRYFNAAPTRNTLAGIRLGVTW